MIRVVFEGNHFHHARNMPCVPRVGESVTIGRRKLLIESVQYDIPETESEGMVLAYLEVKVLAHYE